MRSFFLLLSCTVLLTACAPVPPVEKQYNVDKNVTVYETKEIDIPGLGQTSKMAPSSQSYMVARAICSGQNCSPSSYTLHFVSSGQSSSQSYGTDVAFTTDDGRITWGAGAGLSPSQLDRIFVNTADNTIAEISVSAEQMRKITNSSSIQGRVGPYNFSLSKDEVAPLRKLMEAPLTSPSASSQADSTSTTSKR